MSLRFLLLPTAAGLLLGACGLSAPTIAAIAAAGSATAALTNADVALIKDYCSMRNCNLEKKDGDAN